MFNSEAFISETINSVIAQTYTNWELLLIDDSSTDRTIEIANQFITQHSNIKLLKNEINSGAAISRNKGIEAAQGKYIAFLDANDVWKPQKLQILATLVYTADQTSRHQGYTERKSIKLALRMIRLIENRK